MAIFQRYEMLDTTPTITAGAYSDGDVIGGLITVAVPGANKTGLLNRLILIDDANQADAIDVFVFSAAPNTIADNAAFAPTEAALEGILGKVSIAAGDYWVENSLAVAEKNDLNDVLISDGGGSIYVYLVCNGSTPTYAATDDLTLRLGVLTEG